jgi:hypothetical protein
MTTKGVKIMTKKFNVDIVIGGSIPVEVIAETESDAYEKIYQNLRIPEKYAEYLKLLEDWQELEIGNVEETA